MIAAASSVPPSLPVFFCFSVRLGFRRPGRFLVSGRIQTFAYRGHVSCRPSLAVVVLLTGSLLPLCRQTSAALSCPVCSSSSPSHTDYSFTSIRSSRLPHSLFLAFPAFSPLWTRGRRPSRLSTNRGPWNAPLPLLPYSAPTAANNVQTCLPHPDQPIVDPIARSQS